MRPKAKDESILVVSQIAKRRKALCLIINRLGYMVEVAAGSDEALSRIKTRNFDLVISDLKLPRKSGLALLREVKGNYPSLPFILCADSLSIETITEAVKLGAACLLQFPCSARKVKKAIESSGNGLLSAAGFIDLPRADDGSKQLKALSAKLKKRIKKLKALCLISESLDKEDGQKTFDTIAEIARKVTGARSSAVMLLDRDNDGFLLKSSSGDALAMWEKSFVWNDSFGPLPWGNTGGGLPNEGDEQKASMHERTKRAKTKGLMAIPLKIRDEMLGIVAVAGKTAGESFTNYDFFVLENLAKKASMKIENEALYNSIYTNLMETLMALVFTIEAKDPYTKLHSQRVTRLSMILAEEMGLGAEVIDTLRIAGFLHDIGKIGIPDSILLKPAKLTGEEYAVIQTHPVIGEKIVKPLGLLPQERAIIRHHHERWDGRGVPDGLRRDNIPLEARLLSFADAYDAMVSDRPYRKAKAVAEAVGELDFCSGSQFDPKLIGILKKALNKGLVEKAFLEEELIWARN